MATEYRSHDHAEIDPREMTYAGPTWPIAAVLIALILTIGACGVVQNVCKAVRDVSAVWAVEHEGETAAPAPESQP